MPELLAPEEEGRQELDQLAPSALAILNQSEHAAMVSTANYPANRRKLMEFDSKLMAYANHSQPIALSMFYSLPRAGKQLVGASVRFAEIVAPCWRNCAVASRVIGDSSNSVTAQGVFIDYEANLRNSIEVPRRITDKEGKRYSDDMIISTSNAAMSVARRNAVLKGGVPQALWTPAYEAAQLTAVGKAVSHAQRVADAMDYLHKLGVTEWQILGAVGVPSIKELETEHLVTLKVLCQEIKRGEKTIEEVFGSSFDKEIDSLFVQLKMNNAQQTMLRNSYLGRGDQLVSYLRERLGPARQTIAERVAQSSTPAWNAKNPITESDDKSKNPTISDDFNRVVPATQSAERTVVVEAPDGGTSAATVVSGGAGEQGNLTIPDDKPAEPRRRGRGPSRIGRAVATVQGALEAQQEASEQDARQQVENLVEQTDMFAF